MAQNFSYDANGAEAGISTASGTSANGWNFEGKLTQTALSDTNGQAAGGSANVFDAAGDRLAHTDNVGKASQKTTSYLVDTDTSYAQVIEERAPDVSDAAGQPNLQARYVWGQGLAPLAKLPDGSVKLFFHLSDGQESVRQLTDASGAVVDSYFYDAWGNTLDGSSNHVANPFRYTGQQLDADGKYYLRARFYNPGTGRFLSHDPLMGDGQDPITLHRYLYAGADSVNACDPDGRFFGSLAETIVAAYNNAMDEGNQALIAGQVFAQAHPAAAMIAIYGLGALNIYGMMADPEMAMATGGMSSMAEDVELFADATRGFGKASIALFKGVDEIGRGTGIMGKLTVEGIHAVPSLGSEASGDPFGWENIVEASEAVGGDARYATRQGASFWRNRGHLLAKLFGGPGEDMRNIVPLFRNVNVEMKQIEEMMRDYLRDGTFSEIYYRVVPVYERGEALPVKMIIEATGVDSSGRMMDIAYRELENVLAPSPR